MTISYFPSTVKLPDSRYPGVFVFGSNSQGVHGAGAARVARDQCGYPNGMTDQLHVQKGWAREGASPAYGISTKEHWSMPGDLNLLARKVPLLSRAIRLNPNMTFNITAIGTGYARLSLDDIAPLILTLTKYPNVRFDERWQPPFEALLATTTAERAEANTIIDSFDGPFRFLSNFSLSELIIEGITYKTVEHAYQAMKTEDACHRQSIAKAETPGQAKNIGRHVPLRKDWETIKLGIMLNLLRTKFADPKPREQLQATGTAQLIEGNHWGDTFWGVCKGIGQNHLGILLMQIRAELSRPSKSCACPEQTDPRTCYDLRYYGHSPVNRGHNATYDEIDRIAGEPDLTDDDGECECPCHEEAPDEDDWYDSW